MYARTADTSSGEALCSSRQGQNNVSQGAEQYLVGKFKYEFIDLHTRFSTGIDLRNLVHADDVHPPPIRWHGQCNW